MSAQDPREPALPGSGGIVFVTGSAAKVEEVRRILDADLVSHPLDLPEVQAVELEDVVGPKAKAAYAILGVPVLVEDTGLFLSAWNGLPGALVKWFVERAGAEAICRMLSGNDDRRATARTVVALFDGELRTWAGEVAGRIAEVPAGAGGFGWDSVFIPEGEARTFAEMPTGEKLRFSMRRRAFEAMARDLRP